MDHSITSYQLLLRKETRYTSRTYGKNKGRRTHGEHILRLRQRIEAQASDTAGANASCYICLCRFSQHHLEQAAISQFTSISNSTKIHRETASLMAADETVTLGYRISRGSASLAIRHHDWCYTWLQLPANTFRWSCSWCWTYPVLKERNPLKRAPR